MRWNLEVSPEFEEDYRKLCGRNAGVKRAVDSKVRQILAAPLHYKPLRAPLQGIRRVHIASVYVLLFEPVPAQHSVRLLRLAHHDEAYGI